MFGNQLNLELYNNFKNPTDTGHSNSNRENMVDIVIRTQQPETPGNV